MQSSHQDTSARMRAPCIYVQGALAAGGWQPLALTLTLTLTLKKAGPGQAKWPKPNKG